MFFTTGLHADYHKVTDSPDKIDYDKLARVATLILRVGTRRGELSHAPAAGQRSCVKKSPSNPSFV